MSTSVDGCPKIVVGSGWWSTPDRPQWRIGDDLTRSVAFFALWHRQVMKCINPTIIIVTDSHAPDKPDWKTFDRVQWIELDRNYGHAIDIGAGLIKTKYCGYTRSLIVGASFALCCEADYFVYVEQDCLLRGEEFVRTSIEGQGFDFFCGQRVAGGTRPGGGPAAANFQNSVLVMNRKGLERFIVKLLEAPETDGELSVEKKMERDMAPHGILRVPYGRSRPIDFSLSHFYAQHMSRDELAAFLEAERLDFAEWFPSE